MNRSLSSSSKRPLTLARALSLTPFALLGVAGCAQLIGLDGYGVGNGSGGSGVGGSAIGGSGGSGAKGGSGGKGSGGKNGAAGEAGSRGEAGASAAGAAGAIETPAAVGCDGTTAFTANQDVIRSCILRAGCSPNFEPVRTISECVTRNTQAALPGEQCNQPWKTCADYEACEHVGIAHDDLCGGTKGTRCEGQLAVLCSGDVPQYLDCKGLKGTCSVYTDDNGPYADCAQAIAPDTCVGKQDYPAYYCHGTGNGSARYYCWKGVAYGATCGDLGYCADSTPAATTADPTPTPDAGCYFNLPACTGADSATCGAGNVGKLCSSKSLFNYDCGSVGLACSSKNKDIYCLAPGCATTDVDACTESCDADGTTLHLCYGGAPYTVDCTAYGFTQCQEGMKSSDSTPFAACRY